MLVLQQAEDCHDSFENILKILYPILKGIHMELYFRLCRIFLRVKNFQTNIKHGLLI